MFYRGTVEDNNDPSKYGRVRVRVHGIHDDTSANVSTSNLPWAEVSGGTDFGLVNGVGVSSILRINTMVWVFFTNNDYNFPVVFAVVKGSTDINNISATSYTNIATIKTASGHIIELNDTSGSEKIEIKHTSGSNIVFNPDGSITINSVNNITHNITGNITHNVSGNVVHNISGNYDVVAGGNLKLDAARIDLN